MSTPVRVVLADSQTLFLDALACALSNDGHSVVAAVRTRHALLEAVHFTRPQVCLADSAFPDGDLEVVLGGLALSSPGTRVVVLTADPAVTAMRDAFGAGARGFVHKSRGLPAVLDAVTRAAAGARVAAASIVPRPARGPWTEHREVSLLAGFLTPREAECLRLLTAGLDTVEMAHALGVSATTVRSHVQAVLTKLGAHSRLEAASVAIRHGLVRSPDPAATA